MDLESDGWYIYLPYLIYRTLILRQILHHNFFLLFSKVEKIVD
jgi:hypothetical protein